MKHTKKSGFTLVELAIVLVIIGLIVGGVLVGQDLIKAATLRNAVSQIEKYDTAVNTFRGKYNGFPGDLPNPTNFFSGITNMNGDNGQGDGDGLIEGISAADTPCATTCYAGENAIMFRQLNQAGYTPEAITTVDGTDVDFAITDATMPASSLGRGARVMVQALGGRNYYLLAGISGSTAVGVPTIAAAITPIDALGMDSKLDDGVPNSGKVVSAPVNAAFAGVAAGGSAAPATPVGTDDCYDSDATPTPIYATTTQDLADSVSCNLGIRASF
jgi:prepilin-type N-terminal cleavage/methylation domain-containing protein